MNLVAERYASQIRESLADALTVLRHDDEHQESAPSGAAQLPTFSASSHGAVVDLIDVLVRDG